MVKVQEVRGRRGLQRFLRVPRDIYTSDSPWVAPLDFERRRFFDRRRNAFFDHADLRLFVAVDGAGRDVGRVAAIDNPRYNEFHGTHLGFFGFFESVDDRAVARALLDEAASFAAAQGYERVHGPVNPSTNHECGLLVEGFDDRPTLMTPFNPPFYERLLCAAGFEGVQDLVGCLYRVDGKVPERLQRAEQLFRRRHEFELRRIDLSDFERELERFKTIYNEAWSANYGFVPLTDRELECLARDLRPLIDPELCWFADVRGETAAAALSLPDFNQALWPLRGRLLPLGWLRLWRGMRRIDRVRGMAMGVRPGFRKMGIDHALQLATLRGALKRGMREIEVSWVLAHNVEMLRPLERVGARIHKRYRLYERAVG